MMTPGGGMMVAEHLGGVTASQAELNVLDGVTAGTVSASKGVVVDSNKDIGDFHHVIYDGTLHVLTAAATPTVAMRFGATESSEGLQIKVYEETIELTNAVFTDTTLAVPAGAVILSVQVNLEAAITGDGSGDNLFALIGIGISGGDEDAYGETAALTKNSKIDTIPDWAINAGETIAIFALKADGDTACTEKFTGGTGQDVRVRIVYAVCKSLDNAA